MSGPHPAVAEVRRAVRLALVDLVDQRGRPDPTRPAPGPLVLVACSGGADSLALAAATAFEAPRLGLRAGAVVVDHGWFDDSPQVAAAAALVCTDLGLAPVLVRRAAQDGPAQGPGTGGPEALARRLRYEALSQAAEQHGAVAVLLGHTLDDQAETVLLGLARGSGARSMAGMAAVTGPLRRPLLAVTRARTHEFCLVNGLQPWHDPANDDEAYTRVRLRRVLAALGDALGPGLAGNLARTAELAREDADALDAVASGHLLALLTTALQTTAPLDSVPVAAVPVAAVPVETELDCSALAELVPAVRRRVLLAALRRAGCPPSALGRRHVLAVDALVTSWRGQGPVHLPAGVVARRRCGTLVLHRGADALGTAGRTDHDRQE
jgi:tRNA(Ile)-lysidine synthase